MNRLNVGCGYKKKKGWINLDKFESVQPGIVWDLNNAPYPFEDCMFDEILADNVLEHVEDIITCMNELWRIAKVGCVLTIIVPKFPSWGAVVDPTHKRYFIEQTFLYFIDEKRLPGIKPWKFYRNNAVINFTDTASSRGDVTTMMKVKFEKPETK